MTEQPRRRLFWLAVFVLVLVFLHQVRGVLLPFVVGMFIAYFLHPVADTLERRGASRSLASFGIITCFFLGIIIIGLIVVPVVGTQLSDLMVAMPDYVNAFQQEYSSRLSHWIGALTPAQAAAIKNTATDVSGMALKLGGEAITGLLHSGMALLTVLSLLLITPIVAFYLLRDWQGFTAKVDRLLPRDEAGTIREQFKIIDRTLAGFVRGQLNVCIIMATYYAIALSVAGLKFGIVIGIATGLLVIFPYVGFIFGLVIGMSVAFFQFDNPASILGVLAAFLIGTGMEGGLITPRLVGGKVGLHPVWVIFGMLSGGALFGLVGVLLAVPATAVIGVLIRFATDRYLHSSYYEGDHPTPAHTRKRK